MIYSPFRERSLPSCRGYLNRPGYDDDRDRGANVLRDEDGQHGTADGEVDQVTGEPVGDLNRGLGLLGLLHGLDDLAESCAPRR